MIAVIPPLTFGGFAVVALAVVGEAQRGQTFAPDELNNSDAPPIVWSTPALPHRPIKVESVIFYTGDRFPHWRRNVFVTALREGGLPRTGQLHRIEFNERWEELCRESLLMQLKQRSVMSAGT